MKTKLPIKNLAKANWLMAVASCGFLGIFLLTYIGINSEVIFVLVQSTVNILVVSFLHILVLIRMTKNRAHLPPKQQRFYRYSITYAITLIYSFCINPVRGIFADQTWRVTTFEQRIVTIVAGSILLNGFVLIMHNLVIAYQAKNDAELENAELKVANAEANNLLLKQQIHPHFLFNALNIIKSLYKKDTKEGDIYIVHLANFLRAAVSSNSEKIVILNDEIKLCTDYIAMQKIRFGDGLRYEIDISPVAGNHEFVPSFSLQPLLENAIKHNDVTDDQPLNIRVYRENGYVVVENNLQRKKQPIPSTGSGLANLMKRYELISGDEVIIREENGFFSILLKILKA